MMDFSKVSLTASRNLLGGDIALEFPRMAGTDLFLSLLMDTVLFPRTSAWACLYAW